jgi:fructose-1,6-bisphosphatase/inositol monophosphatase family enzyme
MIESPFSRNSAHTHLFTFFLEALYAAFTIHDDLGEKGRERSRQNRFGETAETGDVECELVVINTLACAGIPLQVVSEEHGVTTLGEGAPLYTVFLDGIDGSANYVRGQNNYGTMVAVYGGANPRYNDYLCAGVVMHGWKELYLAKRGESKCGGTYCLSLDFLEEPSTTRAKETPPKLEASPIKSFALADRFAVDDAYSINNELFTEQLMRAGRERPLCFKASCVSYVKLARGDLHAVAECTRKGNLEIAVSYPLTREAGGVVVTQDGQSIGDHHILHWNQNRHELVLSVANQPLAIDMLRALGHLRP